MRSSTFSSLKFQTFQNAGSIFLELSNPTSALFSLDKVEKSDSGTYTCRLENPYGSLEAEFDVYIGTEMPFFVFNDDKGEIESGTFGGNSPIPGIPVPKPPAPTIDQPRNMTVRTGHIAQFVCKVEWRKEKSMIRVQNCPFINHFNILTFLSG